MTLGLHDEYVFPSRFDPRRLTIIGDRQSGKTFMITEIAVRHARLGEAVVIDTPDFSQARNMLWDLENISSSEGAKVRSTYCDVTWPNGGKIVVRPTRRHQRIAPDVHLIDCCEQDLVYKSAKLVVRTVLR